MVQLASIRPFNRTTITDSPKEKENCECPWRLKTTFEYASATGSQSVESRKLRFHNLAHLAQWRRYYLKEQRSGFEDHIETSDLVGFSDLLQVLASYSEVSSL